ncbi:hypothetical protein [Clostridium sp. DJ247]|uniref:hypothetical protein n=1 Tax=Clostridium sp. DJ247 TaxID=2726188 RepID=UPI00162A74B7|nr:hypothetical protein [Clostridium sp. DJ247]MBC2580038.1 hypothetical protein [Clostridium sp. DJ247]
MVKKSTRNSDILHNSKENTSPKIYALLVKLVNDNREDLAEVVLKVDYLLQYASTSIKQKDFEEAREGLNGARMRIDMLKKEDVDTEHLEYLYEGIHKKCKK